MLYQLLCRTKRPTPYVNQPYIELHTFDTNEDAIHWCETHAPESELVCYKIEVGLPPVVIYVRELDYTTQYIQEREERRRRAEEYERDEEEWKRMSFLKKLLNIRKVL